MAGADVSSTHHACFNGVAERLQRIEQPVRATSSEVSAVLKSEPARAAFSDQPDGFEVEARPRAVDAFAPGVGAADVLTRRAARDKVGQETEVGNKSPCGEGADVVVEADMGIVLRVEHAPPWNNLAGGDGDEARPVQAQRPAAGRPREQLQHTQWRIGHGDARRRGDARHDTAPLRNHASWRSRVWGRGSCAAVRR